MQNPRQSTMGLFTIVQLLSTLFALSSVAGKDIRPSLRKIQAIEGDETGTRNNQLFEKFFFGGSDGCGEGEIDFDLEVITDRFPQDTSYVVTDLRAGGREVFSKKFEYGERNVEHQYQECLPCSTYKFEIFDSHGDGLYYYGGFGLKIDGELVIAKWPRPGANVEFTSLNVTFSGSGSGCTLSPTGTPTAYPTLSLAPSNFKSSAPTLSPTMKQTSDPTVSPTPKSSSVPSLAMSSEPTIVMSSVPSPTTSHEPSFVAENCREKDLAVYVDILTDKYAHDTQLTVYNDEETFFTAPQPFLPEKLNKFSFCLPCGVYELYIKDSYGDGIYAPGGYNVTVDGSLYKGGKVLNRGVKTELTSDKCTTGAPSVSPPPSWAPTTEEDGVCKEEGDINFKFVLYTDKWAEENSVTIGDTIAGKTVLEVKDFKKNSMHEIKDCLPCGNYTLNVLDSDNDGITSDGLKLYVDGKLEAAKKVEGEKTSVNFSKKCPTKEYDVYLLFSQDIVVPDLAGKRKFNATEVAEFESAMASFTQEIVNATEDPDCTFASDLVRMKYFNKTLSTKYALKCATSVEKPELYRFRFLELVKEKGEQLLKLLKVLGVTEILEPKYIGDKPLPPLTPTTMPSAAPSETPVFCEKEDIYGRFFYESDGTNCWEAEVKVGGLLKKGIVTGVADCNRDTFKNGVVYSVFDHMDGTIVYWSKGPYLYSGEMAFLVSQDLKAKITVAGDEKRFESTVKVPQCAGTPTLSPTESPSMLSSEEPTVAAIGFVPKEMTVSQTFTAASELNEAQQKKFQEIFEGIGEYLAKFLQDTSCKPSIEILNQLYQPSMELVVKYKYSCVTSLPDPDIYERVFVTTFPPYDIMLDLNDIGITDYSEPEVYE